MKQVQTKPDTVGLLIQLSIAAVVLSAAVGLLCLLPFSWPVIIIIALCL